MQKCKHTSLYRTELIYTSRLIAPKIKWLRAIVSWIKQLMILKLLRNVFFCNTRIYYLSVAGAPTQGPVESGQFCHFHFRFYIDFSWKNLFICYYVNFHFRFRIRIFSRIWIIYTYIKNKRRRIDFRGPKLYWLRGVD